jgi:hypothetical protein
MAALGLLTGDPEGSASLLGAVDAYPGTTSYLKLFAVKRLRQRRDGVLDPEALTAALEHGSKRELQRWFPKYWQS